MADHPVAGGHDADRRHGAHRDLFDELCDLVVCVDRIPDTVLRLARAVGPPSPECDVIFSRSCAPRDVRSGLAEPPTRCPS
jgi:hypothetical protein